mgnify:CR=1 FL=1
MPRRTGRAGVRKRKEAAKKKQELGQADAVVDAAHFGTQLALFKDNLEQFALTHRKEISSNPEFRRQFQRMCVDIGVDPISSNKGFWASLLGVGDFYYELGVQIVDECLSTRPLNGGLIELDELVALLRVRRGARAEEIGADDVIKSVEKLRKLGSGFSLVDVGSTKLVVSVPCELNRDHEDIMAHARRSSPPGFVTQRVMRAEAHPPWTDERTDRALQMLLRTGMVWVDDQAAAGERQFWFPSLSLA